MSSTPIVLRSVVLRRRTRTVRALIAACSISAVSSGAHAQPAAFPSPTIGLQWSRVEAGCADSELLTRSVNAALGRAVLRGETGRLPAVVGSIGAVDSGFHAHVELRDNSGHAVSVRDLRVDGRDCSRLDESVAVVMALMVDSASAVPRSGDHPYESSALSLRVPARPPRASTASPIIVGLGLGAVHNFVPSTAIAWQFRVETEPSWSVPAAVSVRGVLPKSQTADGLGGEFSAWLVNLHGCPRLVRQGAIEVQGCLGLGAGVLTARPIGLVDPKPSTRVVGTAEAGLGLRLALGGAFRLRFDAGVLVPWYRERYFFRFADGAQHEVHRESAVVPSVWLTFEWSSE